MTEQITGLQPNTTYRWVFCGSPDGGGAYVCAGPHGNFDSTTADPPKDYGTFTTAVGWTIQTTPNPRGATQSHLSGVSCASSSACTAVGNYTNAAGTRVTLAERRDGTIWTFETTRNPAGATSSSLWAVSCTSATACTAVGDYNDAAGTQMTLAERWDGATWTVQPTPNPAGATSSRLLGVSCKATTACTAVGDYKDSAGDQLTLAERWNGTTWTAQPTPNPAGATSSRLVGVSCTSATACTAVGDTNDSASPATLAERWDGTSWTIQATADVNGTGALIGVSCTSATACTAVGLHLYLDGYLTLAERWDGTTWIVEPTPNPGHAGLPILSGVSCTSAIACTAVGSGAGSLAERWDGASWIIQTTPNLPAGSLSAVSCTSANACTAVGDYTDTAGTQVTLAERYSR